MASRPCGTKRSTEMFQTAGSSTPSRSAASTPAFLSPSRPSPAPGGASSPPPKRGKFGTPAKAASPPRAPSSPPLLRGLSSEQPALWARLDYTPEGARVDTACEAAVLARISEHYDIPAYLPVPLSGLTGEERLRVAYYQGYLTPKKGRAPPALLCSACGVEGHAPDRCAA